MRKIGLLLPAVLAVAACIFFGHRRAKEVPATAPARQHAARVPSNIERVKEKFGHLPVTFEENRGQSDPRVKFLSRGPGYGLFLSPTEATLVHDAKLRLKGGDLSTALQSLGSGESRTHSAVRLSWMGANPNAKAQGLEGQGGKTNYLIGNDPRKWRHNIAHYGRVAFREVYPGIDLVYHGADRKLEFDYVVAPHRNPAAIQVAIDGPSLVSVDEQGQLSISSAGDDLTLRKPVAYQEQKDGRHAVDAKYVLTASHQFGFQVGAYDTSLPLVIDPVLDFAANFGNDLASDVVLDIQGNMYVTGTTCETDFPTTVGAFQTTGGNNLSSACNKAIVSKLDPSASTLIYSTYIGGSGVEFASRLLVDASGEATVVGTTTSPDFPANAKFAQGTSKAATCDYGPFLKHQACSYAFLLKLKADGSGLVYGTLFGGERVDIGIALAQDAAGNSYIAGATNSTQLPVNSTSLQQTYGGGTNCQQGQIPCFDGFIAKFGPGGLTLLASTYLGGNDDDFITALTIDKTTGNVFTVGSADSTNFPTTTGALQTAHAGTTDQRDVFLSRLDATLHTLQYSTFLGGANDDIATFVRVDAAGAAYVTGSTISSNFPVTDGSTYKGPDPSTTTCGSTLDSGAIDSQPDCGDIFLAKIDPSKIGAAQLVFSKLIGGQSNDHAYNLALDSQGNIWLAGATNSSDFPYSSDAYYKVQGPVLMEFKNDGSQVLFSSGLSSFGGRLALGLSIDGSDNVFVAGEGTISATPGAYADASGTIFVMKFSQGTARPALTLSATQIDFTKDSAGHSITGTPQGSSSDPKPLTVTNSGTSPLHLSVSIVPPLQGAQFFSEFDNCGEVLAAAANCIVNVVYSPDNTSSGGDSGELKIFSDAPGSPASVGLSGRSGPVENASFVPAALSFPNQAPGTTSAAQSANLDSAATFPTSIFAHTTGAPVLSGANAADFQVDTTNCALGQNFCSLSVKFAPAPSATGTRTATVTVPSNAANSPQTLTLTGTVAAGPAAKFSPINPISTIVGQTSNTGFAITNTGAGTLHVTNITVATAVSSEFVVSASSCSFPAFNLASQQTCTLNLAFAPTVHGNRTATLTMVDDETAAASTTVTVYAGDTGGPQLSLNLPSNAANGGTVGLFGDTVVGRTTIFEQSLLNLFNFASPGPISGAHITGVNLTGDFVQTNDCPAQPLQLTGGAVCTFTVEFAPKSVGLRTGTLTITTDAPGNPTFAANFSGTGVTIPGISVSPTLLDFRKQQSGTTTITPLTVTVKNTGVAPLNLSNIALSGPFTQTNTCGSSLAANATCAFSVKFAPSAAGPAGGSLSFSSNAAGGLTVVGLSGVGVTGPSAQLTPTSLTFGNQPIGTTSASQHVTLTNVGDTAFNVNGATVGENFIINPTGCPQSLAPSAACTINIAFAPTNDTFQGFPTSGAAFIDVSVPGNPLKISLSGTATPSTGAATLSAITSAPNPSTVGQSVTLTATVTSQTAGTITGTATFFDSATQLGSPVTLNAQGKATLTTSALAQGNHSLFFQYSGDTNFAPSTSSGVLQTVTAAAAAATTTTLMSSANPSTTGQSVTFTAAVTSQAAGTITGSVTFKDGTTALGSGAVSAGQATFATSALAQGAHTITAVYGGDTNFATSTSAALTQTVNAPAKTPTATTLTSAPNPSNAGVSVTFTAAVNTQAAGVAGAKVNPQTSAPITGTVTFLDGTTTLGTGTLAGGTATFMTSTLTAGTHSITARYEGDATFATSTSTALTQTVNAPDFSVSANPTLFMLTAGQSGTSTFTVTPVNGSTQTVNFSCGAPQAKISCTFVPTQVTLDGTHSGTSMVTIQTTANVMTKVMTPWPFWPSRPMPLTPFATLAAVLLLLVLLASAARSSVNRRVAWSSAILLLAALSLASCSGMKSNNFLGTPPGTYTITVTAAATVGGNSHPVNVTVTVH